MPYKITFEPIIRIPGLLPKTVERDTAAAAWQAVDGLFRSDEDITNITVPNGTSISWQELRDLATKEAN